MLLDFGRESVLLNISPRASGAICMVAIRCFLRARSRTDVIPIPSKQWHDCQQNESGGMPSAHASASSLTPTRHLYFYGRRLGELVLNQVPRPCPFNLGVYHHRTLVKMYRNE